MATYRRLNRSRRADLGALAAGLFESAGAEGWGAKLFEWWNPEQVQAEYDLTGREAPEVSLADVLLTGREQALETAREAGERLEEGFSLAKKALVIGAILYGAHLLTQWKKGRR